MAISEAALQRKILEQVEIDTEINSEYDIERNSDVELIEDELHGAGGTSKEKDNIEEFNLKELLKGDSVIVDLKITKGTKTKFEYWKMTHSIVLSSGEYLYFPSISR